MISVAFIYLQYIFYFFFNKQYYKKINRIKKIIFEYK